MDYVLFIATSQTTYLGTYLDCRVEGYLFPIDSIQFSGVNVVDGQKVRP